MAANFVKVSFIFLVLSLGGTPLLGADNEGESSKEGVKIKLSGNSQIKIKISPDEKSGQVIIIDPKTGQAINVTFDKTTELEITDGEPPSLVASVINPPLEIAGDLLPRLTLGTCMVTKELQTFLFGMAGKGNNIASLLFGKRGIDDTIQEGVYKIKMRHPDGKLSFLASSPSTSRSGYRAMLVNEDSHDSEILWKISISENGKITITNQKHGGLLTWEEWAFLFSSPYSGHYCQILANNNNYSAWNKFPEDEDKYVPSGDFWSHTLWEAYQAEGGRYVLRNAGFKKSHCGILSFASADRNIGRSIISCVSFGMISAPDGSQYAQVLDDSQCYKKDLARYMCGGDFRYSVLWEFEADKEAIVAEAGDFYDMPIDPKKLSGSDEERYVIKCKKDIDIIGILSCSEEESEDGSYAKTVQEDDILLGYKANILWKIKAVAGRNPTRYAIENYACQGSFLTLSLEKKGSDYLCQIFQDGYGLNGEFRQDALWEIIPTAEDECRLVNCSVKPGCLSAEKDNPVVRILGEQKEESEETSSIWQLCKLTAYRN